MGRGMRIGESAPALPPPRRAGGASADSVLLARLRARRRAIEEAILTRIQGDGAPTEAPDPEYAEGLRAAVPTALDYCLEGIERGEANPPPIPTALLSQARIAARNRIGVDTVLRRYFAGYTLLGDFILEEAEGAGLRRGSDLKRLLRILAAGFDRLLGAVGEEYARELASSARGSAPRRAAQIQRLLAGEPLDAGELGYDLEAHHTGTIAKGPGAIEAIRGLAKALDRRLLSLVREEDTVWAWLGGRGPLCPGDIERRAAATWPPGVRLAIGESATGRAGWRLTHEQAKAAMRVALRGREAVVRYADVALLASVLQDDVLSTSLRQMYLEPLKGEKGGGDALRETLRAYFAAGGSNTSAAVRLGVKGHTVTNRLRVIEKRLGRSLSGVSAELQMALWLDAFDGMRLAGARLVD